MIKTRNGKIILAHPESRFMVVRLWPSPAAWAMDPDRTAWFATRPHILYPECKIAYCQRYTPLLARRTFQPYRGRCHKEVRHAFEAIPEPYRKAISPFNSRQWHVLSCLARIGEPYFELLDSNPALGWSLASAYAFRPCTHHLRTVRRAIKRKRTAILEHLNILPATESTLRRLEKIPAESLSIPFVFRLRSVLNDPSKHRLLGFMPSITPSLLHFFLDDWLFERSSPRFLIEVSNASSMEWEQTDRVRIALDVLEMTRMLGLERVIRFHSLRQLRRLHDELAEMAWREAPLSDIRPFPPPPLAGTETIHPISSLRALHAEGLAMRNCSYSYAERIFEGRSYLYHFQDGDTKATIELAPIRSSLSLWRLAQLRGKANAQAEFKTLEVVQDWLRERQPALVDAIPSYGLSIDERLPPAEEVIYDDVVPF